MVSTLAPAARVRVPPGPERGCRPGDARRRFATVLAAEMPMHYADSSDFPTAPSPRHRHAGTTGIRCPPRARIRGGPSTMCRSAGACSSSRAETTMATNSTMASASTTRTATPRAICIRGEHGTAAYVPGSRDLHDVILASQPGDYVFKNEKVTPTTTPTRCTWRRMTGWSI